MTQEYQIEGDMISLPGKKNTLTLEQAIEIVEDCAKRLSWRPSASPTQNQALDYIITQARLTQRYKAMVERAKTDLENAGVEVRRLQAEAEIEARKTLEDK